MVVAWWIDGLLATASPPGGRIGGICSGSVELRAAASLVVVVVVVAAVVVVVLEASIILALLVVVVEVVVVLLVMAGEGLDLATHL